MQTDASFTLLREESAALLLDLHDFLDHPALQSHRLASLSIEARLNALVDSILALLDADTAAGRRLAVRPAMTAAMALSDELASVTRRSIGPIGEQEPLKERVETLIHLLRIRWSIDSIVA